MGASACKSHWFLGCDRTVTVIAVINSEVIKWHVCCSSHHSCFPLHVKKKKILIIYNNNKLYFLLQSVSKIVSCAF